MMDRNAPRAENKQATRYAITRLEYDIERHRAVKHTAVDQLANWKAKLLKRLEAQVR